MAWFNCNTAIAKFKAVKMEKEKADIVNFFSNVGDVIIPEIKTAITPVQSGSGDPSPSNPRPISGWDSVKVSATGKNLFGGQAIVDNALAIRGSASRPPIDDTLNTVTVNSAQESNKLIFKPTVKANTVYTFIMTYSKNQDNRSSNLQIKYTDGTTTSVPALPSSVPYGTKDTVVVTTTSGKTVDGLYGYNQATTSTFYCDECGMFEGDISASEFEPYNGQTATIPLPHTVYGGELDIVSGSGSEEWGYIKVTSFNSLATNSSGHKRASVQVSGCKNSPAAICNCMRYSANYNYGAVNTFYNSANLLYFVFDENEITTLAEANAWLEQNELVVVYPLSTTTELTTSPVALNARNGTNNVWSDCGQTSLKYYDIRRATT